MADDKKSHTPKDSHYAKLRRAHRDQKPGGGAHAGGASPRRGARRPRTREAGLSGSMACTPCAQRSTIRAARSARMLVTRNAQERLGIARSGRPALHGRAGRAARDRPASPAARPCTRASLIEAEPLKPKPLAALGDTPLVVVLDQVTDPHNVGAIMRSAVAFGAGALITTSRHSPHESGVLAKSASGALEHIDLIEVKNLADALGELHEAGFQTIGLDSDGPAEMEKTFAGDKIALVLGAEGKGLRQKTRETVTTLARLDMPGAIRSLNVSNAAAVALYAARKFLGQ